MSHSEFVYQDCSSKMKPRHTKLPQVAQQALSKSDSQFFGVHGLIRRWAHGMWYHTISATKIFEMFEKVRNFVAILTISQWCQRIFILIFDWYFFRSSLKISRFECSVIVQKNFLKRKIDRTKNDFPFIFKLVILSSKITLSHWLERFQFAALTCQNKHRSE